MFNVVFFLLNAFPLPPILRHWEQAELNEAKLWSCQCVGVKSVSGVPLYHTGLQGTLGLGLLTK